jgi:hypothetical protein
MTARNATKTSAEKAVEPLAERILDRAVRLAEGGSGNRCDCIMCWLVSMQRHRCVSRDMLMYQFELGHVHLQILGLLRISRTVQWMLESAHRDAVHLYWVVEGIGLPHIYLASFACWLFDDSNDAEKTRRLLDRLLRCAETVARLLTPFSRNGNKYPNPVDCEAKSDNSQGAEVSIH